MYLTLIATYAGIFIAVEAKVRTFPNAEIQSEITSDFLLTRSAILRVLYILFYPNILIYPTLV